MKSTKDETSMQEIYKSKKKIAIIILTITLGSFYWGYVTGEMNSALDTMIKVLKISQKDEATFKGILTASIPVGGFFGSLSAGLFLNCLNRRKTLIMADFIGILGCILMLQANIVVFLLGRFVCGYVAGLNCVVVALFLKETVPASLIGYAGTIPNVSANFGTLIAYLLGIFFSQHGLEIWRWVFSIPIITCVIRIALLTFFFKFDTPLSYVFQNDQEGARQILGWLYQQQYVEDVLEDYKIEFQKQSQQNNSYRALFQSPQIRYALGLCFSLAFFLQYCGATPVVYCKKRKIFTIIKTYSPLQHHQNTKDSTEIFQTSTNGNQEISEMLTAFMGLVPFIATYCSGFLARSYGRKPCLFWGMNMNLFNLIIISILSYYHLSRQHNQFINVTTIIFIFIFRGGVSLLYGPNSYGYFADVLPEKGVSFCYFSYWLFNASIAFLFPILTENFQLWVIFIVFGGFCLACSIFVFIFIKETKGLSRNEIEDLYAFQQQRKQSERKENSEAFLSMQEKDTDNTFES